MPSDPSVTEPPVNGGRQVTVSFSVRGLLVLGAALVVGWAVVSAASAILVILVSVFAALVLDPPVTALARRTGMSRARAATLTVLGLVVVGVLITLALAIPLLRELRDLIQALPQIVAEIRDSNAFHRLDEQFDIGSQAQVHASDIAGRVPDTLQAF